jgi:hypothetical protein
MSTAFEQGNFPDAVDSSNVGWMLVDWKIMHEPNRCATCGPNYSLKSHQFEDMPIGTTREEAIALFRKYKRNRRENIPTREHDAKRNSLFLVKVIKVANITDDSRGLLLDEEIDNG